MCFAKKLQPILCSKQLRRNIRYRRNGYRFSKEISAKYIRTKYVYSRSLTHLHTRMKSCFLFTGRNINSYWSYPALVILNHIKVMQRNGWNAGERKPLQLSDKLPWFFNSTISTYHYKNVKILRWQKCPPHTISPIYFYPNMEIATAI